MDQKRKRKTGGRRKGRPPAALVGALAAGLVLALGVFVIARSSMNSGVNSEMTHQALSGAPVVVGPGNHAVPRTKDGPDLHFATTAVDFGLVPLNTEVGHSFSLANVGSDTLRISDVQVRTLQGC